MLKKKSVEISAPFIIGGTSSLLFVRGPIKKKLLDIVNVHQLSTAISFNVSLIEIYLKRHLSYICVSCTSCRWQVACSVWWISTILYTSDIRNANISFPPKTTFPAAYVYLHTSCYLAGTSFAHPSASNFPSEWKTFASCFCDIQEKLHCQILIFSCQKFQHKHR